MKITVLSRNEAIQYTREPENNCVIISISEHDGAVPIEIGKNQLKNRDKIKGLLGLFFDDVEAPDEKAMNIGHAETIVNFVNEYINEIDEIIVHCGAGISRSAGIAAGLALILNGSDAEIFGNGKYCPNATCYKNMLTAYFGSYDREAVEEKFKGNIEQWLKEQDL